MKKVPVDNVNVLDAEHAAALFGISLKGLYDAARRGEIPGRKIFGRWRFSRKALMEWLGEYGDMAPTEQSHDVGA